MANCGLRGKSLNYKMVAMDYFKPSYLGLPNFLGFGLFAQAAVHRNFLVKTIFGKSHDHNSFHVTLTKTMLMVKKPSDAKSVVWIS